MERYVLHAAVRSDRGPQFYTYSLRHCPDRGDFVIRCAFPGTNRPSVSAPIHRHLARSEQDAVRILYHVAARRVSPRHLEDVLADLSLQHQIRNT